MRKKERSRYYKYLLKKGWPMHIAGRASKAEYFYEEALEHFGFKWLDDLKGRKLYYNEAQNLLLDLSDDDRWDCRPIQGHISEYYD